MKDVPSKRRFIFDVAVKLYLAYAALSFFIPFGFISILIKLTEDIDFGLVAGFIGVGFYALSLVGFYFLIKILLRVEHKGLAIKLVETDSGRDT